FVGDDRLAFLVPQDGRGNAAREIRDRSEIDLRQPIEPVDPIAGRAREVRREGPALVAHMRVNDVKTDRVLQTLELAEDDGAVGPGAGIGDVEMVAPGLCGKTAFAARARRAVLGDPAAERGGFALELAA